MPNLCYSHLFHKVFYPVCVNLSSAPPPRINFPQLLNMGRKVVNVRGSSVRKPSSGSWISKLKSVPKVCPVKRCTQTNLVGGHVRHANAGTSQRQYITPICHKHNAASNTKPMPLKKHAPMTRALK